MSTVTSHDRRRRPHRDDRVASSRRWGSSRTGPRRRGHPPRPDSRPAVKRSSACAPSGYTSSPTCRPRGITTRPSRTSTTTSRRRPPSQQRQQRNPPDARDRSPGGAIGMRVCQVADQCVAHAPYSGPRSTVSTISGWPRWRAARAASWAEQGAVRHRRVAVRPRAGHESPADSTCSCSSRPGAVERGRRRRRRRRRSG